MSTLFSFRCSFVFLLCLLKMVKIDEVLERYSKKLDRAIDRHSNKRSVSSTMDEVFRYLRNIQNKPVPVQLAIGASSGL
jgi:hypothetical protein